MTPSILIDRAAGSQRQLVAYFDLDRDLPRATLFAHGLGKGESVGVELLASPKTIAEATDADWLPVPMGTKRCALTADAPVYVLVGTGAYRVVSNSSAGPLRVGLYA